MIIEKGKTQRWHVATPERATWHDDVIMTSPGGSVLLTSAVGPAEVNVDHWPVNRVSGVCKSVGAHGSVSQYWLTSGTRMSGLKPKKKKGLGLLGRKWTEGPTRLGSVLTDRLKRRLAGRLGLQLGERPARAEKGRLGLGWVRLPSLDWVAGWGLDMG